jgi:UDP-GlcNAc:undecaprenyl-phosphate GlcNAc-1-phosphate transferase
MSPLVCLYLLAAGACASLLAVPVFKGLSLRLGILDVPRPGRIHSRAMPLLGGPAIFTAVLAVVGGHFLAAHLLIQSEAAGRWLSPQAIEQIRHSVGATERLVAILVGAVAILAIGVADDVRSLPVWLRLGSEATAAGLVVALGVQPELYFLPRWLVYVIAVLWIVGLVNSFNLIDSMDGLSAGVAAIAAGLLGFWALLSNHPMVAALMACLAGVLAGFLVFNSSPASIFLGSSGSMLIGYFMSVAVLVSTFMTGEEAGLLPIAMPVLVLGVPLYDTFSVVVIRLRRGRSPLKPDLNHLAHRLHRLGLSRRQTVLFIYLMTFAVGLNAVLLGKASLAGPLLDDLVVLVQVLAVFGVVVVLETVASHERPAWLATPVPAEFTPGPSPPAQHQAQQGGAARLAGSVVRLSASGAEMTIEGLPAEAAGKLLASAAPGRLTLRFEAPFEGVQLAASVRAVAREEENRWQLEVEFPAPDAEARRRIEFALEHYRAMGEG